MKRKFKIHLFGTFFTLFCLFQINGALLANEVALPNGATMTKAERFYNAGYRYYENKKYDEAITQLKSAVALESEVAKYHHILAVSYGREAERCNWFKAMSYAKKTLAHLEKSAELDPDNLEILDDLMDFYREAPGFLGGDTKKADETEALIKKLSLNNQ